MAKIKTELPFTKVEWRLLWIIGGIHLLCAAGPWALAWKFYKDGKEPVTIIFACISFAVFLCVCWLLIWPAVRTSLPFWVVIGLGSTVVYLICVVTSNIFLSHVVYAPADAERDVGYPGFAKLVGPRVSEGLIWGYLHPVEGVFIITSTNDTINFPVGEELSFHPTDSKGRVSSTSPPWGNKIEVPSNPTRLIEPEIWGNVEIPSVHISQPVRVSGYLRVSTIVAVGSYGGFVNTTVNVESKDNTFWIFPSSFVQLHRRGETYLNTLMAFYFSLSFQVWPGLGIALRELIRHMALT